MNIMVRTPSIGVSALAAILMVVAGPFTVQAQTLLEERLVVGESRVIALPFVAAHGQVSQPKVATFHVREGTKEGVVTGIGPGSAVVTVFDSAGSRRVEVRVHVAPVNTEEITRQIKVLLEKVEGVSIKPVGDKVFIDGEVLSVAHMQRIDAVVRQFPGSVVSLVRYGQMVLKVMAEKIEREMGHPGLTAEPASNGGVLVRGEVGSKEEYERALKIARSFAGALKLEEAIEIRPRRTASSQVKTVEFVFVAMEVHRDALQNLGIKWSGNFGLAGPEAAKEGGGGPLGGLIGLVFGTLRNFLPTVQAMNTSGKARTLHKATLAVRSGEKGQILVGGEVAIAIPAQGTGPGSVQYKEYGIKLAVEPTVDPKDMVDTKVIAEVSNIAGYGAGGAPNFQKNAINTSATLASDETMVLGGLTSMADRDGANKIPGLGSIPGLGALFNSSGFQKNETELLMTLTPIVRKSGSEVGQDLKQTLEKSFPEAKR